MIAIRPEICDKGRYLPLLLEADPSPEMIGRYLDSGELYLLEEDGTAACVAVVQPLEDGSCELKNLATRAGLRGRGHAGAMVEWLCARYTQTFSAMVVGTSGYGRSFYTRLGFVPSHTVENFFLDHYPQPLLDEDGSLCDHMYYLRRALPVGEEGPAGKLRLTAVAVGSPAYESTLDLRQRVMRLPLGLDLYQGDLSREGEFVHFAALDERDRAWGVVVAEPRPDGTADVRAAAVDLRVQRTGCGRGLMAMMEDDCRARGLGRVVLHARKTAAGFYERLGYVRQPGEFIEVTIPHCRMEKKL